MARVLALRKKPHYEEAGDTGQGQWVAGNPLGGKAPAHSWLLLSGRRADLLCVSIDKGLWEPCVAGPDREGGLGIWTYFLISWVIPASH